MKRFLPIFLSLLVAVCACQPADPQKGEGNLPESQPKGLQLMNQYCGACHTVPSPSDLDQKTWKNHILVRMGAYMGIYNDNIQYFTTACL